MEEVPAVWTVDPEADRDELEDLLRRLAERLEIPPPELENDSVLLPPDYPAVAEALDEIEPGWREKSLLIPPEP